MIKYATIYFRYDKGESKPLYVKHGGRFYKTPFLTTAIAGRQFHYWKVRSRHYCFLSEKEIKQIEEWISKIGPNGCEVPVSEHKFLKFSGIRLLIKTPCPHCGK